MRIAGGVLGLIGAVIALIVGALGAWALSFAGDFADLAADLAESAGDTEGAAEIAAGASEIPQNILLWQIIMVVLPIIGIVGSAMSFKNAMPAVIMMAISGVGLFIAFGFNFMAIICAGLLLIGALLVFMDREPAPGAAA